VECDAEIPPLRALGIGEHIFCLPSRQKPVNLQKRHRQPVHKHLDLLGVVLRTMSYKFAKPIGSGVQKLYQFRPVFSGGELRSWRLLQTVCSSN
jgi:hypothetical protein